VGRPIPLGAGQTSGRLARLSEVAHGRKEVLIVPKGLSEKAARELADMGYKCVRDYEGGQEVLSSRRTADRRQALVSGRRLE